MLTVRKIAYDLFACVRIALCQEHDGCHANTIHKHGFCYFCVCVCMFVSVRVYGCVSTGGRVLSCAVNAE
jgi:hypothetical protein